VQGEGRFAGQREILQPAKINKFVYGKRFHKSTGSRVFITPAINMANSSTPLRLHPNWGGLSIAGLIVTIRFFLEKKILGRML
jgi:hypothetical protein